MEMAQIRRLQAGLTKLRTEQELTEQEQNLPEQNRARTRTGTRFLCSVLLETNRIYEGSVPVYNLILPEFIENACLVQYHQN